MELGAPDTHTHTHVTNGKCPVTGRSKAASITQVSNKTLPMLPLLPRAQAGARPSEALDPQLWAAAAGRLRVSALVSGSASRRGRSSRRRSRGGSRGESTPRARRRRWRWLRIHACMGGTLQHPRRERLKDGELKAHKQTINLTFVSSGRVAGQGRAGTQTCTGAPATAGP